MCIVDEYGTGIRACGASKGASIDQFNNPCHLAVDDYENVLVADSNNDRVLLLSPELFHLGEIEIPDCQLNDPQTLHFDVLNHRLYIGERGGGRIFVLEVKNNDDNG